MVLHCSFEDEISLYDLNNEGCRPQYHQYAHHSVVTGVYNEYQDLPRPMPGYFQGLPATYDNLDFHAQMVPSSSNDYESISECNTVISMPTTTTTLPQNDDNSEKGQNSSYFTNAWTLIFGGLTALWLLFN